MEPGTAASPPLLPRGGGQEDLRQSREEPPPPPTAAASGDASPEGAAGEASPRARDTGVVRVSVPTPGTLGIRLRYATRYRTVMLHAWEPLQGEPGPLQAAVGALDPASVAFLPELGDVILEVGGSSVRGLTFKDIVDVIRGLPSGQPRVFGIGRTEEGDMRRYQRLRRPKEQLPDSLCFSRADTISQALGGTLEKPVADWTGHVNDRSLRKLTAEGVPEESLLRGVVWRYLLHLLPQDRAQWRDGLARQRALYYRFLEDLTSVGEASSPTSWDSDPSPNRKSLRTSADHFFSDFKAQAAATAVSNGERPSLSGEPSSDSPDSGSTSADAARYKADRDLCEEIHKDVIRTHPDLNFYLDREQGPTRYGALQRILFVYAKLNPGVRYVQGMNELLGTLYYVFTAQTCEIEDLFSPESAEPDSFVCFSYLMGELRDVYVEDLDDSESGIQGRMQAVHSLLERHDAQLCAYLDGLNLDPTFYSLRWITTLLSREFNLPDTLRLWDWLFAEPDQRTRMRLLLYFCISMLVSIRDQLLSADFATALDYLQCYPPNVRIDELLGHTEALRRYDQGLGRHPSGRDPQAARLAVTASRAVNVAGGAVKDAAGMVAEYSKRWLKWSPRATSPAGSPLEDDEAPDRRPPQADHGHHEEAEEEGRTKSAEGGGMHQQGTDGGGGEPEEIEKWMPGDGNLSGTIEAANGALQEDYEAVEVVARTERGGNGATPTKHQHPAEDEQFDDPVLLEGTTHLPGNTGPVSGSTGDALSETQPAPSGGRESTTPSAPAGPSHAQIMVGSSHDGGVVQIEAAASSTNRPVTTSKAQTGPEEEG
mmetsp:Transcript_6060/g.17686  ORF Transcript_6060/g.17686 Transcript_6060/m.17686 type:complete len:824 (-) Transcript_6060:284-2755(-)